MIFAHFTLNKHCFSKKNKRIYDILSVIRYPYLKKLFRNQTIYKQLINIYETKNVFLALIITI